MNGLQLQENLKKYTRVSKKIREGAIASYRRLPYPECPVAVLQQMGYAHTVCPFRK